MDGIDQLLEQFGSPENGDDVPVYESAPDNFSRYGDTLDIKNSKYKPKLDSILELSGEFTMSKGHDLLSMSEKKMIQEELMKARNNN